jgi:hydroxyacylglutathione hydrolase
MVDDILAVVAAKGMRVISVIENHLHADSVSGCRELARRTGAFRFFSAKGASTTSVSHQREYALSSD